MSLETWVKAHYEPYVEGDSLLICLQKSLRKWRGLTKGELIKHGVTNTPYPYFRKDVYTSIREKGIYANTPGGEAFHITGGTCALCERFTEPLKWVNCSKCPLIACGEGRGNPYDIYIDSGNPKKMLGALRKAIKKEVEE